jgi:uncharacterized protein (TIGR00251 family)
VIRDAGDGVEISVRVIPRSRKTGLAGRRGDALLVRLAAPPVEGAANAALIDFLAERLQVPRRSITIVSGEKSREKRVRVVGVTAASAAAALST